YTGSAPLVSGEIGEDLTAYLWRSEQTPSLVSLGVLVDPDGSVRAAGGLLVQVLPGADPDWSRRLEHNARALAGISRRIEGGLSPREMVALALEGFPARVLDQGEVRFGCRCSRERVEDLLAALGREELTRMLEEDEGAELTCRFCGQRYRFGAGDLRRLLAAQP
ncbi:MAG TPA: Hsp33 family molecular chaperone HslO, partial [Bacillota bacterium]